MNKFYLNIYNAKFFYEYLHVERVCTNSRHGTCEQVRDIFIGSPWQLRALPESYWFG